MSVALDVALAAAWLCLVWRVFAALVARRQRPRWRAVEVESSDVAAAIRRR